MYMHAVVDSCWHRDHRRGDEENRQEKGTKKSVHGHTSREQRQGKMKKGDEWTVDADQRKYKSARRKGDEEKNKEIPQTGSTLVVVQRAHTSMLVKTERENEEVVVAVVHFGNGVRINFNFCGLDPSVDSAHSESLLS
ncbi:hypothetical protein BJ165DRAFT_1411388 [Panaeolus papilionaceus]|nr:hypothetical protein BJ165DRAFT_1411388 [Panaeolus papilionaceus]